MEYFEAFLAFLVLILQNMARFRVVVAYFEAFLGK